MESLVAVKPRLGFAGVGWIGKNRMESIIKSHAAEIIGVSDPDPLLINQVEQEMPELQQYASFEAMLDSDLDGIAIATPSALHAAQALAALHKGKAVFCQKPLGRNEAETTGVVDAARSNNLLLEVDFSYRYTQAVQQIKKILDSGELGEIYGIHLTFHNAYGPNKPWYYNPALSGGGCLMDLGIHLIDLLFWLLDKPVMTDLHSRLFHKGKLLSKFENTVEDYAVSQLVLNNKMAVQLTCSWHLPAGRDAIIEVSFYGENGGVAFRNVKGSFYDFVAERFEGTTTQTLAAPPDDWGGRAAVHWAEALAQGKKFDPGAQSYVEVAHVLDALYQNCS